ncbi:MAG TPA: hypothetical protein VF444_23905 [Pseudonocardiaceae bacterium]
MTTDRVDSALADRLVAYAAGLRASGAITSPAVEAAFASVERHRFRYRADEYRLDDVAIPPNRVLDLIYANNALLTHTGEDGDPPSSSSAPSLMGRMIEALHLTHGMRVLEIGAGTGYNAALIHHITGTDVVTVEAGDHAAAGASAAIRSVGIDQGVHVIHGDGYDGYPDGGPYDRIIVTCGIAGIPPAWLDQLRSGALIVAPVAHAGVHPIVAVQVGAGEGFIGRVLLWGDFMPAAGNLRPAGLFHHDPSVDIPARHALCIPDAWPALDQRPPTRTAMCRSCRRSGAAPTASRHQRPTVR